MEQTKREVLLLILMLLFFREANSQHMLTVASCKQCVGVIIEEKPKIIIPDFQNSFLITKRVVMQVENLLCQQVNSRNSELTGFNVRKLRRKLRHSHRQYYGYINKAGDTIIVLQTIDYRASNFDEDFKGWENTFIVGLGDSYYRSVKVFKVNISTRKVSVW